MSSAGAVFLAIISVLFWLVGFGIYSQAKSAVHEIEALASFIIAAILTPSPDMVNQTMLALPMIALPLSSTRYRGRRGGAPALSNHAGLWNRRDASCTAALCLTGLEAGFHKVIREKTRRSCTTALFLIL
jgi:hypothetical protein